MRSGDVGQGDQVCHRAEGLAMVSVYSSLVFSRTAAANASGSVPSTNVVSMPRRRSVTSNCV